MTPPSLRQIYQVKLLTNNTLELNKDIKKQNMELLKIFTTTSTASTLLFLSIVGTMGILLGKLKLGRLKLGIAGVLFVGLFVGHLGANINHHVLHMVKEFGLILFVYTIGIEIGPRFLSSLRNDGMRLNILAALIVILGLLSAIAVKVIFDLDTNVVAGLFSGAVTNTPSLGAVQALITEQFGENGSQLSEVAGMAYAVAYPFGILGILLAMIVIRMIFKIDINKEVDQYNHEQELSSGNIETISIKVTNPNLFGQSLATLTASLNKEFVISRLLRNEKYLIPDGKLIIKEGDILIGLCRNTNEKNVELIIGEVTVKKDFEISGDLSMRHILMTNRRLSGKTLTRINLSSMFPANVTRVFRGETEIIPSGSTTLEFGDTIRVVGRRERMDAVANFLGNSLRDLSHPNLVPLFIGIFLGILLGSIPFSISGLPAPAKLGLAGGPLIIALILGHKGRIGNFDFYMTPSANRFIRELGIVLFLGAVGIGSGKNFVETIVNGGYMWMLYAALITFIPLFTIGVAGRLMKINYLSICGYLAGSMTDPPALEFANGISPIQAQATAYATVYPLTMFLRILFAQILVIFFT
ncbi:MAG: transporter [Acidobacteria bacterium]|nr:MAG: transporter [Acidobacteriota bacterium]